MSQGLRAGAVFRAVRRTGRSGSVPGSSRSPSRKVPTPATGPDQRFPPSYDPPPMRGALRHACTRRARRRGRGDGMPDLSAPEPIVEDGIEVDPLGYVPPTERLDHDPDEPTGMAGGDDTDAINAAREGKS